MSPSASARAFLQSIIPAPVRSRRAFTSWRGDVLMRRCSPSGLRPSVVLGGGAPARRRLGGRRRSLGGLGLGRRPRRPARRASAAGAGCASAGAGRRALAGGCGVGLPRRRAWAPAAARRAGAAAGAAGAWPGGGGLRRRRGCGLRGLSARGFLGGAPRRLSSASRLACSSASRLARASASMRAFSSASLRARSSSARKSEWPSPIDLAERLRDQRAGADRVVVAGDHEVDPVGVAVGVDEPDDRDAQPLRFLDGDRLGLEVDHEHRVGDALHVLDAAEVGLQLREVGLRGHPLARRQQRELALGLVALEVVQPADAPEIVSKFVSSPPSQRWLTYGMPAASATSLIASRACFLVPTNSTVPPRWASAEANSCACCEQRLRLEQVDDVDAAALAEDEAAHLRVPAARLVAEVDAGLQQLRDAYLSHDVLPLNGGAGSRPEASRFPAHGRAGQGREPRYRTGVERLDSRGILDGSARLSARASTPGEVGGQRRADVDRLAGDRMREREARGVQELARQAERARRRRTRGRRRPGVRSPAGARGSGACGRSPASRAAARSRRARARARSACAPRAGRRCRSTCACARAGRGRSARRSCRCARAGSPRRARGTRARARALRIASCSARWAASDLATTSRPGGVAVEAVDDPGARRVVPAGGAAGERLRQRGAAVPARRVHDDARPACRRRAGARPRRRPRTGRPRRRRLPPRPPAPARPRRARRPPRGGASAARAPSTCTRPGVDQPLRLRARARAARGEQQVEPLARRLGRDLNPQRRLAPRSSTSTARRRRR